MKSGSFMGLGLVEGLVGLVEVRGEHGRGGLRREGRVQLDGVEEGI